MTNRPTLFPHPMLGWKEHVSFPRLKLGPLVAKIDTGAQGAALHADEIEIIGRRVRFVIENGGRRHTYRAPLAGHKRVKSSNGQAETRPVIRATLQIGHTVFKAEVSLTNRTDMGYPMLIGRTTIKGRFIVNPARSFMLDRKKKTTP
jgi:hypothetical protein